MVLKVYTDTKMYDGDVKGIRNSRRHTSCTAMLFRAIDINDMDVRACRNSREFCTKNRALGDNNDACLKNNEVHFHERTTESFSELINSLSSIVNRQANRRQDQRAFWRHLQVCGLSYLLTYLTQ